MKVDLSKYNNCWYQPPGSFLERGLWFLVNAFFFNNALSVFNRPKVFLLRLFGAQVGQGVVIKPSVSIKFPRNLVIGDHTWIGEHVWIDNLALVRIGSNCCVSQGVYICTGNHDWSDPGFGLKVAEVCVEDGAWVCAKSTLVPGAYVAFQSVIGAGAVFAGKGSPAGIYIGNPASLAGTRLVKNI